MREALAELAPDLQIDEIASYPSGSDISNFQAGDVGIVIVGLSDRDRGLEALRLLHSAVPAAPIAAIGEGESANLMLDAMRAGARDYLWPPFERSKLENLLASMPRSGPISAAGRLIAFSPAQPNDGASTLAVHFAHSVYRRTGKSVLLLDCDLDCSVVCFRLGIKPAYHLGHALGRLDTLGDLWSRITTEWKGLRILPSPAAGEPLFDDLADRLPEAARSAAAHFDFVIADLPASMPPNARQIARDAEALYLVSTAELVSAHLAGRRRERLRAAGVAQEAIRFVVNRSDSRNAIALDALEEAVGMKVSATLPNDYDAVSAATMRGGLVSDDSRLGRSIEEFVSGALGAEDAAGEKRGRQSKWMRMLSIR